MLFQVDLSWPQAAAASACLGVPAAVVRGRSRGRRWVALAVALAREAAVVLGLYALWVVLGSITVMSLRGAAGRGRWLWHAERVVRLPSEAWLQRLVLPHSWLVQAANFYYGWLHVPALLAFLLWLFVWHRDAYPRVRNCVVVFTAASLAVQLIPVAPPRLIAALGIVDTPARFGQSVYSPDGAGSAGQLAAMPSVHVGWALLVAVVVVLVSDSRWRWLVVLHPLVTVFAVVVTGNHYWLDGAAAAVLVVASMAVVGLPAGARAARGLLRRRLLRAATARVAVIAGSRLGGW